MKNRLCFPQVFSWFKIENLERKIASYLLTEAALLLKKTHLELFVWYLELFRAVTVLKSTKMASLLISICYSVICIKAIQLKKETNHSSSERNLRPLHAFILKLNVQVQLKK